MTRARREASSRPLSLVSRTFKLVQDGLPTTYGGLLLHFSVGGSSASGSVCRNSVCREAFRLFGAETRVDWENKEVQLYQLGPMLLERYRSILIGSAKTAL